MRQAPGECLRVIAWTAYWVSDHLGLALKILSVLGWVFVWNHVVLFNFLSEWLTDLISCSFPVTSPVILRWASVGPLLLVVWAKNWTEFVNDDMYWLSGGCGFEIPLEVGHMTGPCRLGESLRVWDQFLLLKQSDKFPITMPSCVERCLIFFPLICLCFILNKVALQFPDVL